MNNKDEIRQKVREIMANVFREDIDAISDDASPDTLRSWDSIGQMNLIMSLEEEFELALSDEQTEQLRDFESVARVIQLAL